MDIKNKRSAVRDQLSPACLNKVTDLGGRLKAARKRRGWSIEAVSKLSGVSPSTLKLVEAGDISVGFMYYLALFQLFGLITDLDGLCTTSHDILAAPLYCGPKTAFVFDQEI